VKCISGVAPNASQVATGEPHKNARQPGARSFSLNRAKNFRNDHFLTDPFSQPSIPIFSSEIFLQNIEQEEKRLRQRRRDSK
jgi:hypothetical protein